MKRLTVLLLAIMAIVVLATACSSADIASSNISRDADMFRVNRQIVFYNGITGEYMLVIEGRCSLGNSDPSGELSVTCKVGENEYKKHFLGLSDNVTYVVEQLDPIAEDVYNYKMIFKPSAILPDIEIDVR